MTMGKSDSNPLYSRSTYSHFPGRGGGEKGEKHSLAVSIPTMVKKGT